MFPSPSPFLTSMDLVDLDSVLESWNTNGPIIDRKLCMHFELRKNPRSSPHIKFRFKHQQIKLTYNGPQITSTRSSHLVQVPDLNVLIRPDSCEPFVLSNLSGLECLSPEEKNQVAKGVAHYPGRRLTETLISSNTNLSILAEIKIREITEEYNPEALFDMILEEKEKEKPLVPGEGAASLGTCAICLEEMGVDAALVHRLLPCRHLFHESCIYTWCSKLNSCPLCRSHIVVGFSTIPPYFRKAEIESLSEILSSSVLF